MGAVITQTTGNHRGIDPQLYALQSVFLKADERLQGSDPTVRVWPTGFPALDEVLNGGFRAGGLALITGTQGLGKTTFTMQIARNAAVAGRSVIYFSYEHDPESLLEKFIAMEMGHIEEWETPRLEQIRAAFEARSRDTGSLRERMSMLPYGLAAMDRVMEYSHRLHLHRSTGSQTTLEVITNAVRDVAQRTGEPPLIVVDYLQKVKVPNSADLSEDARVTVVVEELKDLAIHAEAPVLAIVAGDKEGLGEGMRMRARHMRGSTALAYECDTLLILNGKHNIVAKHHLTYDLSAYERFREWVIVTIEKNRMGKDGVDLEFKKRFDQSRFDALGGGRCKEQLVDERVFTE